MYRSVNVLDLPETANAKLKAMGYEYCEDLENVLRDGQTIPSALKEIIDDYNIMEALNLKKPVVISSVDLWNNECCAPPVSVFHKGLDRLLKGGFPIGKMSELCGAPGSGKTQICLQAAIDVQIPSDLGGSSGEALFISTDFGFRVERLKQMSRESVKHISKIQPKNEKQFTVQTILNGVNVVKISGHKSLFNVVVNLENYLKTNSSIKLVIIDSFSLPLVTEVMDLFERTKMIHIMLDKLQELSVKYQFAVLLTNQLTTVVIGNSEKKLIPSLGESFGHRLHKRILLDDGKACLMKSIDQPRLFAEFQITEAGIR